MARYVGPGGGALRIGIPLEPPAGLLDAALAELAEAHPDTRAQPRHLSTADQLAALRAGELDVGFLRERPVGPEFDALLVVRENLGVLLAREQAAELAGPDGVALDAPLVGSFKSPSSQEPDVSPAACRTTSRAEWQTRSPSSVRCRTRPRVRCFWPGSGLLQGGDGLSGTRPAMAR
ncbi:LysR substrate-binding domain-containing protein [Streptomyces chartreusis]